MKVLLVGAGNISIEYYKVLVALDVDIEIVTRGEHKARIFERETGILPYLGGVGKYLEEKKAAGITHAIVAVGIEGLMSNCVSLLECGIKNILVEKPGGLNSDEITSLADIAKLYDAKIVLGYNRRFYSSVEKALEIIAKDGGVELFHFEFTEWGHQISKNTKALGIKEYWFLADSTHVVDLAFFLGGNPVSISTYTSGGIDWHPSATVFAGAGRSQNGALFTYLSHWEAPGRWGVELLTKNHRLFFRPLEKLFIQRRGELTISEIEIDDRVDKHYKPGLYQQVKNWVAGDYTMFRTIQEQAEMMIWYDRIANYKTSDLGTIK